MEEEIKGKYSANVRLVAGSGGVFEVVADGATIYSKSALGRFPAEGEIVSLLQKRA